MLQKFYKSLADKKRSQDTLKSIAISLGSAQTFLNDKKLEDAKWEEDILRYIQHLRDKGLAESSIELIKSKLKQFYIYCYDETDDSKYRKLVKHLKGKIPQKTLVPQDLITPTEAKRLINIATLEQDRAIVGSLYEGGLRIGELIHLKVGMVAMDEEKQEVTFNIPDEEGCKTGARSIVCLEIYGYVQDWLKCHPNPGPEESFIQLGEFGISKRLENLFDRAGIKKPCNAHMLRHAAITHAVTLGMQQNAICMRFWGKVDSQMLKIYIHLSEQMQADAYKKAKGMKGDGVNVINPLACRCVKCGRQIQAGDLCQQCKELQQLNERNQTLQSELEKQNALIEFMMQKYDELINGK